MSSGPDAAPSLDVARERVVRLLTDRYADDTLTVGQFEAELDRLHGLGDVAALEQMAAELTTGARPAASAPSSALPYVPPSTSWAGPGWQRGALVPARVPDAGRVAAFMSSSRRAGPWAAPRLLHVWAVMSEAVVDLRDAVLPAEGCEIEVAALMANVKIFLPTGVHAQVEVLSFMGSAHDLTAAEWGDALAPRVRVTGSCVMAEVKVLQGAAADLEALELDD